MAQDMDEWQSFVGMVTNFWIPQYICCEYDYSWSHLRISRRTLLHGVSLVNLKCCIKLSGLCNMDSVVAI